MAEAAGRRQSSPYYKTPWGLIPKAQYNAPFVQNPAKLQQYREREAQALEQMQQRYQQRFGTNGTTDRKPTTRSTTKKP